MEMDVATSMNLTLDQIEQTAHEVSDAQWNHDTAMALREAIGDYLMTHNRPELIDFIQDCI